MESWLLDVKRVRIPRPKFGSGSARHGYPMEPPKDYYSGGEDDNGSKLLRGGGATGGGPRDYASATDLAKATEELRRAVQEKL